MISNVPITKFLTTHAGWHHKGYGHRAGSMAERPTNHPNGATEHILRVYKLFIERHLFVLCTKCSVSFHWELTVFRRG
jgi:hypothetical protein